MPLLLLTLSIAFVAGGVYLIVVTVRRYGFDEASRNVISRPGAMLAGGVLLLMAACMAGVFAGLGMFGASSLRQTWEEELTKMFGQPPDRLEIEERDLAGSLSGSRGIAYYGTKRYRIECRGSELVKKDGKEWWRYTLKATPIEKDP
jgi:hypothetical protein